ncbi:Golgi-specific brefeldin A-resistance guanine nucleotide exchange factor 1-like isoform X2 [Limulus polyphemus]|nr:Golgi-specific brefeldin A-resistance guanine nucleotide exchange factor 1-like isoform X2 [Limulus polyphemus]XP_022240122.1 Golgi-specific brefeldin A-resistance guanine nucleotide exchange factor 1-like isoform X2 [Limulus polyphemus]XP_022240129.1 Golgi-specific brefeldin A-resistance guanine nucleotide exchange factor 1-like isoform X2 [Limulus polyphemus]XP_022240136.1 Golgi-specific brefeldin A-resistance guanine nucleotide exchange factor 1-like isoform X2 [Limulus polyphemus]
MAPPANGVYIVIGEMNMLITAMRKGTRWSTHSYQDEEHDPLLHNFSSLKEVLNHITDLSDLEPTVFLTPFLDVIRSEDTTGPVTGFALSSINKFLTYDLLDVGCETAAVAAENIADAVTHARFVGTDPASDEVVLLNILQVLRMLLLNPLGMLLTNESVCEIMQSCFRICFEMRLSELLRKSAEHVLMDMVQLLFSRLIGFSEDSHWFSSKKLKMRASGIDTSRHARKRRSPRPKHKKYNASSPKKDIPFLTPPASTANSPESSLGVASFNTTAELANPELHSTSSEKTQGPQGLVESEKVIKSSTEETSTPLETNMSSRPQNLLISETKDEIVEDTYFKIENHVTSRDSPTHSHCEEESPCEVIETTITESFSLPHQNTIHVDVHNLASSRFTKDHTLEITEFSERCDSSQATNIEQQQDYIYESSLRDASLSSSNDSRKQGTEPLQNSNNADFVPVQTPGDSESLALETSFPEHRESKNEEYVNPRGVRFTSHQPPKEGLDPLVPYGLPCVRELFRFLVSLICPLDHHNTEMMIQIGLGLLKVALEAGADSIGNFSSLLALVKDDMCRNLFLLLNSERLSLFATTLSVCFLLFEALRTHLKFQLEMYLSRLMEIIVSESAKIFYEQRALALDSVVQLWRIPGLVTELYLNYDCDLYCSNLFEDLTKLLSKNAFPVSGLYSTHLLSLDALLTVIDSIETHCHYRVLTERQSTKDDVKDSLAAAERVQMEMETDLKHEKPESFGLLASGYLVGQKIQEHAKISSSTKIFPPVNTHSNRIPLIKPNRMSISENISSHEELMAVKHKKKLLATGTEQFNSKPSKGISFLQENGLLKDPLDPAEVADFLRDNPRLDKWMIGQYISNRKNLKVLEAFISSFNFEDIRIDEALRMYLETFRLPGEAPLISLLLEHFAEHWHKSNREPFANSDAAFTLAYAIIMLNVDQHNHNVKKQNIPMTSEDFKKNLKNVNGGQDFDEEMLEDVYTAIKNEEIVMPAEQTGLVKENYLWKVLLKRGNGKDGSFIHSPNGLFDHDLFSIIWGPTVAALSFVFDKSTDLAIIQKAISGFRKCAMISAHYGMSDVFDNLVISLCKFTTLMSFTETPETLPVSFGGNNKAQLAARTVFNLAHRHGDILREGWKNLLDCILQLYRAKLLPQVMVEAEDFIHPNRIVSLIREDVPVMPRAESGILSSFYSYITLTADTQAQRAPNPEDQAAKESAKHCIQDCHPDHLVMESKFLRIDSLQELVKALIYACHGPDGHASLGTNYNEDSAVFLLEFLIKIVLQNRDRVGDIWPSVRDHLYSLVMGAGASEHNFLLERAVVGILQLAIRLLRREEMAPQVLQTLRILLLLKPPALMRVARQIAYAMHELLVTTAANIHLSQDWSTLFTLMECVGAGSKPPRILSGLEGMMEATEGLTDAGAQSDSEIGSGRDAQDSGQGSERGYTSDSELYESQGVLSTPKHILHNRLSLESVGGWILVGKEGEIETVQVRPLPVNQYNIILECELQPHDPNAFMKVCESLSFLIRDVAHITPENFESCVHCIRLFVEASLNGGNSSWKQSKGRDCRDKKFTKTGNRKKSEVGRMKKSRSSPSHVVQGYDADDDEQGEEFPSGYQEICIQLLDLMHTLHTRAGSIFQSWAAEQTVSVEEGSGVKSVTNTSLWTRCWCPLLQGISRLCCDTRRNVRTSALTYLQRALLVHDLQALTPCEWESCFNKVLFPLLSKLLENLSPQDPIGMEETRMRGATLLCKVFLQHLNPLLSLPTFTALWLTILDFMEKYMKTDGSDLLNEAIPESLKNMLLVMDTAGIFQRPEEGYGPANCQLWLITWDRIHAFLPGLKDEVFKPPPSPLPHVSTESLSKEASPDKESLNTMSKTTLQQQQQKTSEDSKVPPPPQRCPMVQDLVPEINTKDKLSGPSTLTSAPDLPSSVILHPPAFTISPPPPISTHVHTTTSTVPLLLNPSVMGHISPQTLPRHPPCETKDESFLGS